MSLTKPNQQLRRDLKEAAAILKWAGVDLFAVAERMLAAGDEQGAAEIAEIAQDLNKRRDDAENTAANKL